MTDTTQRFADLHAGRTDGYGAVHGECVRQPLTLELWHEHLYGDGSIGVYPLIEDINVRGVFQSKHGIDGGNYYVHFGATDIDHPDGPVACWTQAHNLVKALAALGIRAFPERTKGKGWHVYVYADEWVPAIIMRRALLAAHQIAGVAPTEINPKQIDLGGKSWGNYLNVSFAKKWADVDRRVVVRMDGSSMSLEEFVDEAEQALVPFDTLKRAALLYKEPPKRTIGSYTEPDAAASSLAYKLSGLGFTIWKNGTLEGRDRSGTLQRLAHLMCEADLAPGEAMVLLRDADCRWGKFYDRADGEEQLGKMIEAAYSKVR